MHSFLLHDQTINAVQTLSAENAAALDKELMSSGAYSIDQLMELAGLSVSQAGTTCLQMVSGSQIDRFKCTPSSLQTRVNVCLLRVDLETMVCSCFGCFAVVLLYVYDAESNLGGDGLVAARHLFHYGYEPTMYYPKQSKNDLYQRLTQQLKDLDIPFTDDFPSAISSTDQVVDAIFGFSFSGEVREPFPKVIEALRDSKVPVLAVDAPSSWNIETGPPDDGPGKGFMPDALISLTAPKPLVKWFKGKHYVGGR